MPYGSKFILPVLLCTSLPTCGSDDQGANGAETAAVDVDVRNTAPEITFPDESKYIAKMAVDPSLAKTLGMAGGKIVEFKDFGVYSYDNSSWEKGGDLSLLNDCSLGMQTKIDCQLSPGDGDAFMKYATRRHIRIRGVIKSFSSSGGLTISPCVRN